MIQNQHKVGQDASARLIHDDESVEAFMETHFHEGVQVETVQVVRWVGIKITTQQIPGWEFIRFKGFPLSLWKLWSCKIT